MAPEVVLQIFLTFFFWGGGGPPPNPPPETAPGQVREPWWWLPAFASECLTRKNPVIFVGWICSLSPFSCFEVLGWRKLVLIWSDMNEFVWINIDSCAHSSIHLFDANSVIVPIMNLPQDEIIIMPSGIHQWRHLPHWQVEVPFLQCRFDLNTKLRLKRFET